MREIKFRAWDGIAKDWHTFEITDSLFESQQAISLGMHGGQVESLVWQQYTGLKDRNGVEIYEGDIILVIDAVSRDQSVHEVKWVGIGWTRQILFIQVEVIGNIYENPELLERIESDE